MAGMVAITGAKAVIGRMRKATDILGKNAARGLKAGGKFLFRESQAIVPVDEGNLKGSGFVRSTGVGFKTDVIVGYTADYATFVHENLDAVHGAAYNRKYPNREPRGENQQAKFLEKPAREKRKVILGIVYEEAKKSTK